MTKITIEGWNKGFDKVGFNKFLRNEFDLSIKEAKDMVDQILDRKLVVLDVEPNDLEKFIEMLDGFGLVYQV